MKKLLLVLTFACIVLNSTNALFAQNKYDNTTKDTLKVKVSNDSLKVVGKKIPISKRIISNGNISSTVVNDKKNLDDSFISNVNKEVDTKKWVTPKKLDFKKLKVDSTSAVKNLSNLKNNEFLVSKENKVDSILSKIDKNAEELKKINKTFDSFLLETNSKKTTATEKKSNLTITEAKTKAIEKCSKFEKQESYSHLSYLDGKNGLYYALFIYEEKERGPLTIYFRGNTLELKKGYTWDNLSEKSKNTINDIFELLGQEITQEGKLKYLFDDIELYPSRMSEVRDTKVFLINGVYFLLQDNIFISLDPKNEKVSADQENILNKFTKTLNSKKWKICYLLLFLFFLIYPAYLLRQKKLTLLRIFLR